MTNHCLVRYIGNLKVGRLILFAVIMAFAGSTSAQARTPVLLLSDIHFDPFHDPAKFARLQQEPVNQWHAILEGVNSSTQATDFSDLQVACKAGGIDTSWRLFSASLRAEKARIARPAFVVIPGDILGHKFQCKYKALTSQYDPAAFSAFAAKTFKFVLSEVHSTFPNVPVYVALGNNDTGCAHEQEDENSEFLRSTASVLADAAFDQRNAEAIRHDFPRQGNYSVLLPLPMRRTRLISMQDLYSAGGLTCAGLPNPIAVQHQVSWLREQLVAAREKRERVWILAHIPAGIDVTATLKMPGKLSADAEPRTALKSEEILHLITKFPDVITLGVFGHTHNDEFRVWRDPSAPSGEGVPIKIVSALSPNGGHLSSFTIADVDSHRAVMNDFTVYATSRSSVAETIWNEEYRFTSTYGAKDFTSGSITRLADAFVSDPTASSLASKAYMRYYNRGDHSALSPHAVGPSDVTSWRRNACAVQNGFKGAYRQCISGKAH